MQTTPTSSFEYEIQEENGEKYVVIKKFIGEETEAVIPGEIDGLPVREIGGSAFSGCTGLKSIALPKGLETVGNGAFSGCTGLASFTLPEEVKTIGSNAFKGCTELTTITLPEGLESVGNWAFDRCTGLVFVTLPKGVKTIEKWAFYRCENLTIHAPAGSVAEKFAKENGIPFKPIV